MATTTDEIMRAIGRIEAKQDATLDRLSVADRRLNDHSDRLSALERWRSYLVGIAVVVVAAVGAAFKVFGR